MNPLSRALNFLDGEGRVLHFNFLQKKHLFLLRLYKQVIFSEIFDYLNYSKKKTTFLPIKKLLHFHATALLNYVNAQFIESCKYNNQGFLNKG